MLSGTAVLLCHSGSCFTSCQRRAWGHWSTEGLQASPASGQQPALTLAACNSSSSSGRTPWSLSCHSDGLQALEQTAYLSSEISYWEQMILIKWVCRNLRMKCGAAGKHTAPYFRQMLLGQSAAGQQSTGKQKPAQLVHTGTGTLCHLLGVHIK